MFCSNDSRLINVVLHNTCTDIAVFIEKLCCFSFGRVGHSIRFFSGHLTQVLFMNNEF